MSIIQLYKSAKRKVANFRDDLFFSVAIGGMIAGAGFLALATLTANYEEPSFAKPVRCSVAWQQFSDCEKHQETLKDALNSLEASKRVPELESKLTALQSENKALKDLKSVEDKITSYTLFKTDIPLEGTSHSLTIGTKYNSFTPENEDADYYCYIDLSDKGNVSHNFYVKNNNFIKYDENNLKELGVSQATFLDAQSKCQPTLIGMDS